MDLECIKALIETMAASDLSEMEYSENGWTIRLVRNAGCGASPALSGARQRDEIQRPALAVSDSCDASAVAAGAADLHAPLSGVVHLRRSPEEPALVQAGQTVTAGDTLCLIEAMKVFNSVRADRDGTVVTVLVASGSEVEAGQMLMHIV